MGRLLPTAHVDTPMNKPSRFTRAILLLVTLAAVESLQAAPALRAESYEEALAQAKTNGCDIVVFQRGSDWNRLGEMLYNDVWMNDAFARALGGGFILVSRSSGSDWTAPGWRRARIRRRRFSR